MDDRQRAHAGIVRTAGIAVVLAAGILAAAGSASAALQHQQQQQHQTQQQQHSQGVRMSSGMRGGIGVPSSASPGAAGAAAGTGGEAWAPLMAAAFSGSGGAGGLGAIPAAFGGSSGMYSAAPKTPLSLEHCSLPAGVVKDTCCRFQTAQDVSARLLPVLNDLVKTTVFRYFKVNLHKDCPFWDENALCVLRDCTVTEATENEIPAQWRKDALSSVDWGQSKSKGFSLVKKCESNDDFCQLDEDTDEGFYVNLIKNPERYTGYSGESAARVWKAIYDENCFGLSKRFTDRSPASALSLERNVDDVCTEKRAFYKLISGLHSSISIHICDQWLDPKTGQWIKNLDCYEERIARHPERLENLYFVWAVATRAMSKLSPYLRGHPFCKGMNDEALVHQHVRQVAEIVATCPSTFDETTMFAQAPYQELKTEFKEHFRNISRIMDCVGCEKCRLWGKLQVTGLGTALKVLFSYGDNPAEYRLTRSELVALVNGYHRLCESVQAVEGFQSMIADKYGITVVQQPKEARKAPIANVKTVQDTEPVKNEPVKDEPVNEAEYGTEANPRKLTAEYLLQNMSNGDPRWPVFYWIGAIIAVLGTIRIFQKAYSKNVAQEIQASRDRVLGKDASEANGDIIGAGGGSDADADAIDAERQRNRDARGRERVKVSPVRTSPLRSSVSARSPGSASSPVYSPVELVHDNNTVLDPPPRPAKAGGLKNRKRAD
ncbi:endoplasmic reticulum Oxidoreductin 1-domain-containing protein [Entophlyctis helioformis]|nr:endoplasmic reticulum Oxidoreductin 1-domain-containing protein [Entophlyctis helioformis]